MRRYLARDLGGDGCRDGGGVVGGCVDVHHTGDNNVCAAGSV